MLATFKKLLFGVAFILPFYSSAADLYPPEAHSTRTTVTVNIIWLADFKQVNAVCEFLSNHLTKDLITVGCYDPRTQTIYVVEPANFNDHYHLEILGHEFWHALGATHPVL